MKIVAVLLLALCFARAQYPKYENCPDLTDQDFTETQLFGLDEDPTLDEPLRMDFYQDTEGNINIYFVERSGQLKYFDAGDGSVSLIGELDVLFGTESGLLGIALDPEFDENNWVYFFYSPNTPSVYRIARFTINPNNTLDVSSEVVLLDLPDTRQGLIVHIGGALHFDHEGNLWAGIGEHDHCNQDPAQYHQTTNIECSGEHTATDSKSLYGGVLKIHPEPDGSYTIPEDNYGPYWSNKFAEEGRTVLAQKYADTSLVAPEVYAKGIRNTMSVTVDPLTGWASVSECGGQCHKIGENYYCPPDDLSEKHMLMTNPGFHGWSYFSGKDNHPYAFDASDVRDPLAPVNNSPFRVGVDTLPPAIAGTYVYGLPDELLIPNNPWICAVGAFIYRYDGNNPSTSKFPPHFDGVFMISDMNQSFVRAIEVDDQGEMVSASDDLFTSFITRSHTMDMRQGPDGAMYMLNYSTFQYQIDQTTGIYRIDYTGNCQPVSIKRPGITRHKPVFDKSGIINTKGAYLAELFGLNGKRVFTSRGEGGQELPLERLPGPGVYQLRVTDKNGVHQGMFTHMK